MQNSIKLALTVLALALLMTALWFIRNNDQVSEISPSPSTASTEHSEPGPDSSPSQPYDPGNEIHPNADVSMTIPTTTATSTTPSQASTSSHNVRQIGPKFETYTVNVEGGINHDAALAILDSDVFDVQAEQYAKQAAADPDTARLTMAYSAFIREVIVRYRLRLRLKSLACGSKQCVGALSDGSLAEYDRWSLTIGREKKLPHYTRLESILDGSSGKPELRFIFALDPSKGIR